MANQHEIAPGHDQEAFLLPFHQLEPPLFREYWDPTNLEVEWIDAQDWDADGNQQPVPIGYPSEIIRFTVLTVDELAYIKSLCTDPRGFSGPVTRRTYNATTKTWFVANGTLIYPRGDRRTSRQGYWTNVRVEIIDLVEIP